MTKPVNMTPEQTAAWIERRNEAERRRRAENEATREKENATKARYRAKAEVVEREKIYHRELRKTEAGKELGRKHRRQNYQRNIADPIKAERERRHSIEAGKRFRERRSLNREFESFMASLEQEASQC